MSEKNIMQNRFFFAMFLFCFLLIPGLLLVSGISYLQHQNHANLVKQSREEIGRFYKTMQPFSNGETFWCKYLSSEITSKLLEQNPSDALNSIETKVKSLRNKLKFNYVIFDGNENSFKSSFKLEPVKEWKTALSYVFKKLNGGAAPDLKEQAAMGLVFGPQVNPRHFSKGTDENPLLVWPDSTFKKPLIWVKRVKQHLVAIFIDYKNLEAVDGIWNFTQIFSQQTGKKFNFALLKGIDNLQIPKGFKSFEKELGEAIKIYERQKSQTIKTDNLIIFPRYLRPDLMILGFIMKKETEVSIRGYQIFAVFLFLIFSYFLVRYSYNVFILSIPDRLSLRWKLRFLFFFANGLPLLVLFFLGTDYLNQKRDTLLQETMAKGTAFLQSFDESFETEYAKILVNKRIAEEKLIRKLRTSELNNEIMKEFVEQISDYDKKIILVASRSSVIGTEKGIYDPDHGIVPEAFDGKNDSEESLIKFTKKIGQYFIDSVNGTKISEKLATEIEILVESVTQKPVVNFIFEMMQKRGNFTQWGFGNNVHPAIIDTFTLGTTRTEDYFFIAMFRRIKLQNSFLKRKIPQANRNNLGIKVLALLDDRFSVPKEAFDSDSLKNFSMTLTNFPGDEIKFVNYGNEKNLAMGFIGNSLTDYKLIGLYPVSRIESLIQKQKRQLAVFALLSILLTLALSQIIAHSFLVPLGFLSDGAKAIEAKNFRHRLPEMSRDEFGKMGEIFNDVMVDLDELSVASAIQEQLLPQEVIPTGNFSIFGKSVAMGELGGDYFDFLEGGENHFGVLLGDVAGHGVGAALIMAMAKAGIIQSEHLLDKPVELAVRLHNLIYASKTKKQKKIMTFQYLYLDGITGKGVYTNAGACSPMIIRKRKNKVEELKLSGAALGAFKRANYSEIEVEFEPEDAIVFYTDGIVEARGDDGNELGYDELKKLLLRCWDIDAKTFYDNIYAEYVRHIGKQGAQDDLTMIVLVYTGVSHEQTADISSENEAENTNV
ncbi:MAG: hypothetical protein Kow0029_19710 [Candidatus Rifleibacteriota bacterium]